MSEEKKQKRWEQVIAVLSGKLQAAENLAYAAHSRGERLEARLAQLEARLELLEKKE